MASSANDVDGREPCAGCKLIIYERCGHAATVTRTDIVVNATSLVRVAAFDQKSSAIIGIAFMHNITDALVDVTGQASFHRALWLPALNVYFSTWILCALLILIGMTTFAVIYTCGCICGCALCACRSKKRGGKHSSFLPSPARADDLGAPVPGISYERSPLLRTSRDGEALILTTPTVQRREDDDQYYYLVKDPVESSTSASGSLRHKRASLLG